MHAGPNSPQGKSPGPSRGGSHLIWLWQRRRGDREHDRGLPLMQGKKKKKPSVRDQTHPKHTQPSSPALLAGLAGFPGLQKVKDAIRNQK